MLQNVEIVVIPHPGVGNTAAQYRFQFFCQYRLQVVGQDADRTVLKHQFELVRNLPWGNGIASRDIQLQRGTHSFEICLQHGTDTRVFGFIHDFIDAGDVECNAVFQRDREHFGKNI